MGSRSGVGAALRLAGSLAVMWGAAGSMIACGGTEGAAPAPPADPDAAAPPAAPAPDPGPAPEPAAPAPQQPVRVAFKLDERLTDGLYMGERWVAPATFQAATQAGSAFTVEARIDRAPAPGPVTWTAESDAVAVAPDGGAEVTITISRPGSSTLVVAVGEASAALAVDAVQLDGTWRVTFRQ